MVWRSPLLLVLLRAFAFADPTASGRLVHVENGEERLIDAAEAARAGLATIDLSDGFTPFLFQEAHDAAGNVLANRYRSVYLGLANDLSDGDGQPLQPSEHNYLELYGVPPSLSVLRARFLEDYAHAEACSEVDWDALKKVSYIPAREKEAEAKNRAKMNALARRLELARKRSKLPTLEALAEAKPSYAQDAAAVKQFQAERAAFAAAEKRLRCEKLFSDPKKHQAGWLDDSMRQALVRFQQKNMLYDAAALRQSTMAALSRPPIENDYAALVRALTERAVSTANVLEDGSVAAPKNPSAPPEAETGPPVRNLVEEATALAIRDLGLDTLEHAVAFFERHPATDFKTLKGAIHTPALPEYYGPNMDLSVVIDRGDVIYDPLIDETGKKTNQNRRRFPSLTLRVKWKGQTIPLVRWRTTIGGWRSDLAANGYEYFRYKSSDVGPRVWRNVVSGPVWIAPPSTPLRTLVKPKLVQKVRQLVVNYDEVGPGYLSAYGLVAAYNVVPRPGKADWDNGVRVHGSSEILSIRNPDAYSHGCHRLMNHLAVRLFSFVLRHRPMAIEGDKVLDFARQFLWKDDVMEMRLPSRGFWYRLEPPIPVNVLEGNIIGKVKKPILDYMPKPGVIYPPGPPPEPPPPSDVPEMKAGGEG